ncbi:MAG: ribosome small subunit-dependent GTPase A [Bryobacteraceae bacterium]
MQNSDLVRSRVCFAAQERYRLLFSDGEECEAAPAGALRWEASLPAVGDWVMARRVDESLALIEAVEARRTAISRKQAGRGHAEQVLAANVDLIAVVMGLDADFNVRRLERYLVVAAESGARVLVVLNKADLCGDLDAQAREVALVAGATPCVLLTAVQSVEPLRQWAGAGTVVLLGSSGAGKSTIANGLLGREALATGAVREDDSRGRHTTTNRMLIPLPDGGALIDTPGLRELSLWAGEGALGGVFAEIAALAAGCRFGDCTHGREPGCAVRGALEAGEIEAGRWASYQKLLAEVRHHERASDQAAALAEKQKWKAIHKAMRHHPKYKR